MDAVQRHRYSEFISTRFSGMGCRLYICAITSYYSRCSFSMMVKWAIDGLLQANDCKMLVNDDEILVNDGGMSIRSYTHLLISPSLTTISPSLTSILPSIAWSIPSFANLTIIEKLHRLGRCGSLTPCSTGRWTGRSSRATPNTRYSQQKVCWFQF